MVCDNGVADTTGSGFTSTIAAIGVPVQPSATGVTVNVTFTGAEVVFLGLPTILPVPLVLIPDTVPILSLVQL